MCKSRASHHFREVNWRNSSNSFTVIAITYVDTIRGRGHAEAKDPIIHFEHLSLLWFLGFSLNKEEDIYIYIYISNKFCSIQETICTIPYI